MPITNPNLVSLVRQRAKHRPDDTAYVLLQGEELRQSQLTYRDLDSRVRTIAASLQELKIQGERALLLYPPGLEFINAFFGCLYAGVIAIPAYPPRLNRNALRIVSIARDSGARLALTTAEIVSRLGTLTAHTPELGKLQWLATDRLAKNLAEKWQEFLPEPGELAYLQYTSGSTATPKGVMVSHANVLHNSEYLAGTFRHSAQDVSLSWLPHFHDLGLVHGIVQPMYSGFPGYLMAPMSFLQRPIHWLRAISRFRVTHSDGPNFAYDLCVTKVTEEDKPGLDLASWKMALNGAEPIFPETIERFTAAFAPCGFKREAFYPAYGLAEATLVVSGGKKGDDLPYCCLSSEALEKNKIVPANEGNAGVRVLVASGAVGPEMEVEIVQPASGQKCSPDQIGEIWIAGSSVAMGYWKRPQETERVFKAELTKSSQRRFLRTGDLGFLRDGYLFITGRLKELIIIRGRNYYPQDIERTARESCPAIRLRTSAAFSVSARTGERMVLVQEIGRRQKFDVHKIFSCIREAIAEEHEVQIHEIVLVPPGGVPRTSSGKIQRNLCCKQFLEGALEIVSRWRAEQGRPDAGLDPSSSAESIWDWLVAQVATIIGAAPDRIDVSRPLVSLGLDSLSAVALAHKLESKLGLAWEAATLLQDTSIADCVAEAAKSVAEDEGQKRVFRAATTTSEQFALSYGQQSLWFLHQIAPQSTAYNVAQAIRIKSRVDVQAMYRSFQSLVDRHGGLRTTFTFANGRPVQCVHAHAPVAFIYENMQGLSEADLQDRLAHEAAYLFDLEHGPLLRTHLFTCAPDSHVLLLTAHHIILDLWSVAQIMRELGILYEAEISGKKVTLPPVGAEYSEFVRWQQAMLSGEPGRQLWAYWRTQLAGELPVLNLLTDYRRPPVQTYQGASYVFRLDITLTAQLKRLAQLSGATLYMTLLAAFQALLHRYTGDEEIVTGSPVAGRTKAEFAATVGYFVNPVVLRTHISGDLTFEKFLDQVRQTVLDALKNQDYPFSRLVETVQPHRDPSRSPLFQVMFAMQKAYLLHEEGLSLFALGEGGACMTLGGLDLESLRLEQRIAQFDLSLIMAETKGGLAASFEYNTDLFDSTTICLMAEHFTTLLKSVSANPKEQIARLALANDSQIGRGAQASQPAFMPGVLVHELVERQAARTPDAPALITESSPITYGELNERADQVAQRLSNLMDGPGTCVGMCMERSLEAIIGLLAILKAGAVYVPLDPEYPEDRLAFLLDDASIQVLLTAKRFLLRLPSTNAKVLCIDGEQEESISQRRSQRCRATADDPAYIIYTSGSAGQPKGVLVSHAAFSNHMQWLAREFPIHENDRVLHKYSLSFDASLAEIFHPLITGAALVIARTGYQFDSTYLIELIRENRVTAIDVVPTMLKAFVDSGCAGDCTTLRRITCGGEILPADLAARVHQEFGEIELVNMYGPTEAAITSSFHRCKPGKNRSRTPIGTAVANTQLYILDHDMRPVPTGIPGEIYIGGAGLAYGYINQPQLTAESFVPDAFGKDPGARLYRTGDIGRYLSDGTIEYIRRHDKQVKVRGFRIELGEIEAQLKKHSSVRDVVAILKNRASGDNYIAAYLQCEHENQVTPAQLRSYLRERLPDYMLPAAIVVVEALPLLPSGKLDVRAVPESKEILQEVEFAAPHDQVEQELVRIWQEVLGRKEVGVHSNFFELGGDSILSIQMVSRARQAGLELTPRQIFQFQTIAGLAQVAGRSSAIMDREQLPHIGTAPLTPIQQWFFEQELPEPHFFNQSMRLVMKRALDPKLLEKAFHKLIFDHDALRLRFHQTAEGWRQVIGEPNVNGIFRHVSVSELPLQQQTGRIEAIAYKMEAELNLETGPIIRAVYFDSLAEKPDELLIVIHHLAVDAISWGIILDDLQQAYKQLERGEEIRLPQIPVSFKRWSELLQVAAKSPAVQQESAYWIAQSSEPPHQLHTDYSGENSNASSATLFASLGRHETQFLLREAPRAYRSQINDALLAALAQTLSAWSGENLVLVSLEGHGREEINVEADLSRTVGWFTSLFPVLLEIDRGATAVETFRSVKEQLRRVPAKGIGYGLLRYMSGNKIAQTLKKLPQPQVSFNYLGQLDQLCPSTSLFSSTDGQLRAMKSSKGKRSHLIEIDAWTQDGQLQLQWGYSSNLYRPETIQQLANDFIARLSDLIPQSSERETIEYTPSDFPLITLTQQQIERIQKTHGEIEDIYPLTSIQQGMLFHSLYEPHKATYLTQFMCELEGSLDAAAFREAWLRVIQHYSALRAGLEWEIVSDEPVQIIKRSVKLKWRNENWTGLNRQAQEECLAACLKEDREQEIDLREAPLMGFALMQTAATRWIFAWSCHHLVMDGWSLPIVLKDVLECYSRLRRNEPVKLKTEHPFRDYVAWLKQQDLSKAENFWRTFLSGCNQPLSLNLLRSAQTENSAVEDFREQEIRLSQFATSQLQALARQFQLTINTIAQGAWALHLSRESGQNDVIFGVVCSGRPAEMPGVESMVGLFINTLPMRVQIEENLRLLEWLKLLQERQAEISQFEYSPLPRVQSWSSLSHGTRLFESILVFENYPADFWNSASTEELRIRNAQSRERSNYALTMWVMPGQELGLRIGFDASRLQEPKIAGFLGGYKALLESIAVDPHRRIAEILRAYEPSSSTETQQQGRSEAVATDKLDAQDAINFAHNAIQGDV